MWILLSDEGLAHVSTDHIVPLSQSKSRNLLYTYAYYAYLVCIDCVYVCIMFPLLMDHWHSTRRTFVNNCGVCDSTWQWNLKNQNASESFQLSHLTIFLRRVTCTDTAYTWRVEYFKTAYARMCEIAAAAIICTWAAVIHILVGPVTLRPSSFIPQSIEWIKYSNYPFQASSLSLIVGLIFSLIDWL